MGGDGVPVVALWPGDLEPFRGGDVRAARRSDGWRIESRWELIGGRPEAVELKVASPPGTPVSTDIVRRLPLGTVLAQSRTELTKLARLANEIAQKVRPPSDCEADVRLRQAWSAETALATVGPRRGRRLGEAELTEVARVYRQAWSSGDTPVNEAVRNAFHLSKDGAAKRIMAARKAGLLDGVGPKR